MCKTDYGGGGGGGKNFPKIDYVICERPLMCTFNNYTLVGVNINRNFVKNILCLNMIA